MYHIFEKPLKRCKCGSKKIKQTVQHHYYEEDGYELIQHIPSETCKKCGKIYVGAYAHVMELELNDWLKNKHAANC